LGLLLTITLGSIVQLLLALADSQIYKNISRHLFKVLLLKTAGASVLLIALQDSASILHCSGQRFDRLSVTVGGLVGW
jgi:hypothetical protein